MPTTDDPRLLVVEFVLGAVRLPLPCGGTSGARRCGVLGMSQLKAKALKRVVTLKINLFLGSHTQDLTLGQRWASPVGCRTFAAIFPRGDFVRCASGSHR